jgi:quercetin dioxygenase-like cupin family protein
MNQLIARIATAALLISLGLVTVSAHPDPVVPEREIEAAQKLMAAGPKTTQGIEKIVALGSVPLEGEFEGMAGKVLRAREFVLRPGAEIAVHEHQSRPGVAYILEGELVEHRNDATAPIRRGVGTVAFERTGVVHWWKNESGKPARAIVVDIVAAEP